MTWLNNAEHGSLFKAALDLLVGKTMCATGHHVPINLTDHGICCWYCQKLLRMSENEYDEWLPPRPFRSLSWFSKLGTDREHVADVSKENA